MDLSDKDEDEEALLDDECFFLDGVLHRPRSCGRDHVLLNMELGGQPSIRESSSSEPVSGTNHNRFHSGWRSKSMIK